MQIHGKENGFWCKESPKLEHTNITTLEKVCVLF